MNPITKYIVDRYKFRPSLATIKAMADELHMSENAVWSRLWRAGVIRRNATADYHTDGAIVLAYQRHKSLATTAQVLGVSFYVVRDALERSGVEILPRRGRPLSLDLAYVAEIIKTLRAEDVEWKGIAHRLQISPATLWEYRRRIAAQTKVEGSHDRSRSREAGGEGGLLNPCA